MPMDMMESVFSDSMPGTNLAAAPAREIGKRRRGRFGFFRAAAIMMRRWQTEKDSENTTIALGRQKSNPDWTKFVGSMRPMHLQETANQESPTPEELIATAEKEPSDADNVEELIPQEKQVPEGDESAAEEMFPPEIKSITGLKSPEMPHSPAASSLSGVTSKYNSALSLRDLYDSSEDDEEDPDEVFDAICGDEMIDAKAEAFIAQFYEQIQLQKTAVAAGHRLHDRTT